MSEPDLLRTTVAELAADLRAGRTTAAAVAEVAIARHERLDGTLGAYKVWDSGRARREAALADAALAAGFDLGPFQGLPVSVKDLFGVHGVPTFAGSPKALPPSWETEGPVVSALRAGLATIAGKTHTVEFAYGGLGTNPHWGTPRNPWDAKHHRAPGGSSAGAGVSLWEGSCVLALGTDTAGSVRIPASLTGNVGLKITAGRWSTQGIVPLSRTLDTPGVLARTMADTALAFAVIDPLTDERPLDLVAALAGHEVSTLRVGVCDWFFQDCSPGVAEAVERAIEELSARGMQVQRIEIPELDDVIGVFRSGGITASEFAAFVNTELPDWKATLDPNVLNRFARMEAVPAVDYVARIWRLRTLAAEVLARMAPFDLVVGPTVPVTAPAIDDVAAPEAYHAANMMALRNTCIANMLGFSALTMPVGLDAAGMPVGLQLMAAPDQEELLLAGGFACERVLGTAAQRLGLPPLCA
ncbi:MAG: amidase [Alphaproteobacteria bacterium]